MCNDSFGWDSNTSGQLSAPYTSDGLVQRASNSEIPNCVYFSRLMPNVNLLLFIIYIRSNASMLGRVHASSASSTGRELQWK